jgi:hypothetical protein
MIGRPCAQLAHRMVDDVMAYLETVRERPVWQPIPKDVRQSNDY